MPQFSITSEINVKTLRPDSDNFFKLSTDTADLLELANRFGWVSVDNLAITLNIRKVGRDCWDVSGHISGQIVQNCIVTDALVPENIDFQIEERYVRSTDQADYVDVGLDGTEPIKDGAIDIGELAVQSLCLAASAWPRVDDAPGGYSVGDRELERPFAALSALKCRNRSD